jgi:hypothetical protein
VKEAKEKGGHGVHSEKYKRRERGKVWKKEGKERGTFRA